MTIDRFVFGFAGCMVLLGLALGFYVSPYWYLLTAFVGVNLFQSAVTRFCPLAVILRKFGFKSGPAF